jgi:hypothetical protein
LPVVVFIIVTTTIIISTVRAIRFSVPLVILIFGTVIRGFRARVAGDHNLWYIHDFGLIELRFGARRLA